jgi:hypothetical protein
MITVRINNQGIEADGGVDEVYTKGVTLLLAALYT